MNRFRLSQSGKWTSLAFIVAGFLMIVFWSIYTHVHGPTSFDRTRSVLGRSTLFWGSLLGGIPNIVLVVGLLGLAASLIRRSSLISIIGFVVTIIGLLTPAVVDLYFGGLGPPLFVPVAGIGLILIALSNRGNPHLRKSAIFLLMIMGLLQILAFGWVFVPQEMSNKIGGYRLFGVMVYILVGFGWILFGASFTKDLQTTS
jgi:hypothetical protein